MPLLKKVLKFVLILAILAFILLFFFVRSLAPTYKGTAGLKSLGNQVEVYYDKNGIPHIYAQNELDARRALGYVHAQDRLWQMEIVRRLAAGRLSELFGEKLIKTDKFFSGLGIEEAAEKTIANIDKESEAYLQAMAYLDGINQFIETGPKPIEFYLVGLEKETFTINDIYNVYGYMAFSFAVAHKTDPLLTEIKEKLGTEYLKELDILIDESTTLIKNAKNPIEESGLAKAVNELYEGLPLAPFIGSNSWVIGAEKTGNKKVIFANDPHIGFAQPSVWYQAHIKTPDYEMYGYHLGLSPFPLLGHNRNYAYGLTMFENDDLDFYFEEEDPGDATRYKVPGGLELYKSRKKEIKVKDGKPVNYTIKVSRHGPVMNDIVEHINDTRSIAMDWVYTKLDNKILDVAYKISHANSLQDFKKGAMMLHAPGLNIMYGDSENNIAWFASAKLYKFSGPVNSKLILKGDSEQDQKEYLDFAENPQAINPVWNYVYSANNQPDSIAGILYPGYYLPEDRGKRIVQLLEARNDFTKADVMGMITDVTSAVSPGIVKEASNSINRDSLSASGKEALELLEQWDGSHGLENIGPTVYNRFLYKFLVNTYKDEMGAAFEQFINTPLQRKMNALQMARDSSVWWDDIHTKGKVETKEVIITKSFTEAITYLKEQLGDDVQAWQWKHVHSLEHQHPIGQVASLRKYFNVGPFKINGASEVINNLSFKLDSTGYYKVHSGPSTRRVIDFSEIENSKSILPTGQSGNRLSDHYKDQAEKYNRGEFINMLLNDEEIRKSKNRLLLEALRK